MGTDAGQSLFGSWQPAGGRLVVESVVGKQVTLRGENVVFTPSTGAGRDDNPAVGTFTANFRVTFDNVNGL